MRLRSAFASIVAIAVSFPATAAITGTVINMDGQPVSGAKISIFAPASPDMRRARLLSKAPARVPLVSATSDSKGNFSVAAPKDPPLLDLMIEASDFAPHTTRVLPDEELGALALTAAPLMKGTITAAGKPVAGAIVVLSGEGDWMTTTDAAGNYAAADPAKWANRLIIVHPDFAIVDELISGPFRAARKGLDRTLDAGVAITGRVVSQDGTTPVANAPIFVDNWQLATTAADGTFSVPHAMKDWSFVEARLDDRIAARAHAPGAVTLKMVKAATVTGIVADAKSGTPIAGVALYLAQPSILGNAGITSRAAMSNAKGAYTLTPVLPGSYQLNASRPGYASVHLSVALSAGQTVQKSLVANAQARVVGTVLDENKRPVAGARLSARPTARERMMPMMMQGRGVDTPAAFSGPDGRFVLRAVEADSEIEVDALKRGYPSAHSASMRLAPAERKAGVVITIPHGFELTGKVTDTNGRPVAGVAVEPIEATANGRFGGMRAMVVNLMQSERADEFVRTASDGTFTIKLKEGTYEVVFKREGYAAKTIRGQVVNATVKPLAVTLDPGVEITGRVTRGGIGVAGVNIAAFSQESNTNTVTAADGSFRLADLTPGQMMLNANKREDFIDQMRPVTAPAHDVLIELPAGGRITGHVVDKNTHNPVTSFQAGISRSRAGGGMVVMTPPMLKSFTTDDGSFTLDNVPAGLTQVVVSAAGYTTAHLPGVTVEEGKTVSDLQVDLDTGAKIIGRVTGSDGSPLAGVTVSNDPRGGGRGVVRFDASQSSTITDANGEYTLDAVDAGEKTLLFAHQGYLNESRTVTVTPPTTRLDVQLSTGVRLTGTVTTENGAPVADAMVTASSAASTGFGNGQARTDSNGAFVIDQVAPGHYMLSAMKSGLANGVLRDFDVSSGAPAHIVMKTGGTITGHVMGLSPQEMESATVIARSPSGSSSAPVDSSGNYRIEGAPTGTVRVSANTGQMFGSGKSSPTKSIQVDAGASVQLDLEFQSATVIRGRVTRDGQALSTARINFFPRSAQSSTNASANTDSNGNYEVSGLDDATYNVQIVDFQRSAPFTTTYEVKGSGTFDIDIKSATLRGRVTDATTGAPLPDARIEIHATGGDAIMSTRATVSDTAGNFIIDSVARGTYEAKADKEGYGHDVRSVVVGDSTDPIEFKLAPSAGVTITAVDPRDNRQLSAAVIRVTDAAGNNVDSGSGFRFSESSGPMTLTLSPGTYRVTVAAFGYATQTITVSSPSNATVRMSPGGTVVISSRYNTTMRARLVDSSGMAYARGGFGGGGGVFTIDPSPGVTTLQNIAAGAYHLDLLGSGDQVTKSFTLTVNDGQQTAVEVN